MDRPKIILVLGGARSGKSAFAERLIDETRLAKAYLATGQIFDDEMKRRVGTHQSRRGPEWKLIEEPIDVADALGKICDIKTAVLVDCLTLWVTNLMMAEKSVLPECDMLVEALPALAGTIVLVSNEVGQGIVPDNAMARAFRDYAGLLHQKIAAVSDEVYFVTAGLPQKLKG